MGRWVCAALALLGATGCPPDSGGGPSGRRDGGLGFPLIDVRGRVVDVESCDRGCQGVQGVVIAMAGALDVRSAMTGPDGAFALEGLPGAVRTDLIALPQDTAAAQFTATLNPGAVRPEDVEDVFALELYILPRGSGSVLGGAMAEAGLDLESRGGYVGQAVMMDGTTTTAASGVAVNVFPPQGSLRYVNVLPRRVMGEAVLAPADTTGTTSVGMFVVSGTGAAEDPVAIAPYASGRTFDIVVTPFIPGVVAFGVHAAR